MAFLAAFCLLWAGMVLGISFLEAPVKFTAPSLSLAVGLDVGRHVFAAFHKVEWGLVLACLIVLWRAKIPQSATRCFILALGTFVVQSLWLLPILDARVTLILQGEMPPAAPYHVLYVICEVAKLLALIGCSALCLKHMTCANHLQEFSSEISEKSIENPSPVSSKICKI